MPHVGCPRQCSFCNQRTITGVQHVPTPEEVTAILTEAGEKLGPAAKGVTPAFFGGSFTAIPMETMEGLLQAATKAVETYGFAGIRCSTRPDAVGENRLSVLKQYGVTAVELGVQSFCDDVLQANHRGHTAAQAAEGAYRVRDWGFELGLQMMTGLYGSTPEKDMLTMEQILAISPDTLRIYPTVVLPGTELEQLYRQGIYFPQTLDEAVSLCAVLRSMAESQGIRVIRTGLQDDPSLQQELIAGPYHPGFGELVESKIFYNALWQQLSVMPRGSYLVSVHPKTISVAVGWKKSTLSALKEKGYDVRFIQDAAVNRGSFQICV